MKNTPVVFQNDDAMWTSPHFYHGLRWMPFGIILPNGVTYFKSVYNKNSALVRLLEFVNSVKTPPTKREICRLVFGFPRFTRFHPYGPLRPVIFRGWRSAWFSGLKRAGFVTMGKDNRYALTDLGKRIVEYHNK